MTVRIHHTQHKLAAKLGFALTVVGDHVEAKQDGRVTVVGATAKEAIANAITTYQIKTADVVKKLKAAAPKAKKAKKARKSKFKCEHCGSTKRESDGEEGGGFICSGCGEDATTEDDDEGKSVVKRKYKKRYKPHRQTCGDELSQLITKHVKTLKDPDTGKPKVDEDKLVRFARANGVWDPEYKKLNVGMQRMNIANKLRGMVRNGHEVVWAN